MRRLRKRRTYPFMQVVRTIVRLKRAFAKPTLYAIGEVATYVVFLGIAVTLTSVGLPSSVAFGLSIALVVLALFVSFVTARQHRIITSRPARARLAAPVKGEVKFADWIAQTCQAKAPQEWEEYQDWLHDILLARRQLLASGSPSWQITVITYWRLTGLCVTVSLIKLRRLVVAARKRL